MWSVEYLGLLAGIFLAVGYVLYFVQSVRHEIEPNPTTWLMWAYGTTLLTVVEADLDASWTLLVLPITCSLCGVGIALMLARRGTLRWPHDGDQYAFYIDSILTVTYVSAWALSVFAVLGERGLWIATILILVCSNISTLVSFVPILRSTYRMPTNERPLPWFVWTASYALLFFATINMESGIARLTLLMYPVSCFILHGLVGILALRKSAVTVIRTSL